jgi:hypothetical protein
MVPGEELQLSLLQRLPDPVRLFPGVEPTSNEDCALPIILDNVEVARLQTTNCSHMVLEPLQGYVNPEPPVAKRLHGKRFCENANIRIKSVYGRRLR